MVTDFTKSPHSVCLAAARRAGLLPQPEEIAIKPPSTTADVCWFISNFAGQSSAKVTIRRWFSTPNSRLFCEGTFMQRRWVATLFVLCALLGRTQMAAAGDQDFTLVNKTGIEIHRVFVSPHETDKWGEDILKKDTFPDDASLEIKFHCEEEAADWDLKIEDKDGHAIVWPKLHLIKITKLTLHYDGKAVTAEVE